MANTKKVVSMANPEEAVLEPLNAEAQTADKPNWFRRIVTNPKVRKWARRVGHAAELVGVGGLCFALGRGSRPKCECCCKEPEHEPERLPEPERTEEGDEIYTL